MLKLMSLDTGDMYGGEDWEENMVAVCCVMIKFSIRSAGVGAPAQTSNQLVYVWPADQQVSQAWVSPGMSVSQLRELKIIFR